VVASTTGPSLARTRSWRTLLKYKLHRDQELFEKAYGYIKQYY
jgi:type I restriction enzyme R subunit